MAPPTAVANDLRELVSASSALVLLLNDDKTPLLRVHHWPSWLTRGTAKVI